MMWSEVLRWLLALGVTGFFLWPLVAYEVGFQRAKRQRALIQRRREEEDRRLRRLFGENVR
jgi:hypothetical protein